MNQKNKKLHWLAQGFYLLGAVTLLASLALGLVALPAGAANIQPKQDLQLNLSHIACVNGQVEIHFVLLNVPDGITPGNLTYTYGDGSTTHTSTISPGKNVGNVWHYTDYQSPGLLQYHRCFGHRQWANRYAA